VGTAAVIDREAYCREIEAFLCRKNDGHLIRIVGPAFERVMGWADQGIPVRVAEAGIDRYFQRYYRKGPRRRPVRVEFCEADVLDAFDEWRRAVGVSVVDQLAHQTEFALALAQGVEEAAQYYLVNLVSSGYVVESSAGDDTRWNISFSRGALRGTVRIEADETGCSVVVNINQSGG